MRWWTGRMHEIRKQGVKILHCFPSNFGFGICKSTVSHYGGLRKVKQ